jgi:hypothetical protein
VRLGLAIELAPGDSALGADGAAGGARFTGRPDPARHGAVVSDPRKRGA